MLQLECLLAYSYQEATQALPPEEKQHNQALARLQVRVEHLTATSRFSEFSPVAIAIVGSGLSYA